MSAPFRRLLSYVGRLGVDAVPRAKRFQVKRAPLINVKEIKKIQQQSFDTGTSSVTRIKAQQIKKNLHINCDSWFSVTLKGARWFSKKTLRYSLLLVSMLQNAEKEDLGQFLYDILPEFDESKYEQETFRKTAEEYASVLLQQIHQQLPLDELEIGKVSQDCTIVLDEERELINCTDDYSNASDEVSPEIQITYNMDGSFDTNAISKTDDLLTYSDDEEDDADKANDSVADETSDNVNSVVPSAFTLPQEMNQDMLSKGEEETDNWHCIYQCTLAEYLLQFNPCMHERLLLLLQLFERLDYMTKHNIAHRNLNIDSIYIYGFTDGVPQLVIEDFGRCLVGHEHGLKIPYNHEYIDKGGTSDLMAPEISSTKPGRKSYLDYRKSDLWTAGTLVYQILGADNPFANLNGRHLTSATYEEHDLPPLPDNVPEVVNVLIKAILNRDPNERPTARLSADVLHAFIELAGAQQHSIKNVNSNLGNSQ